MDADDEGDSLGVVVISVGVGTGGRVSGGRAGGDEDVADGDGVGVAGMGVTADGGGGAIAVDDGAAVDGATGTLCFGREEYRTVVTGEWPAVGGAAPRAPSPPGTPTAADCRAGVASCQPTVTAIGRPNATSPTKTDLGDSRTLYTTRREAPEVTAQLAERA